VRILAVDWSGARSGEGRSIWLAEARSGELVRLEPGWTRRSVVDHLLDEAARDPELVVGLDFAFSLPEWFLRERGAMSARAGWALVAGEGERWLREVEPPFWNRDRDAALRGRDALRRTEREVGGQPKSVFQLVGNGQVGPGSIRGMPFLLELAEAFAIWPFDRPRLPLVVEIYPRLFRAYAPASAANEHARDAAAAALAMSSWDGDWRSLPCDERYRLEGRIWTSARSSSIQLASSSATTSTVA
jgi:hypothetical protein